MTGMLVIQKLYDYHYWAIGLLLDQAATLREEQYHAPGDFPHGGIHHTFFHHYDTDWAWGLGVRRGEFPTALLPTTYPTLETLRSAWQEEEEAMRAYLATLTDEQLQAKITIRSPNGNSESHTLYHVLLHIILHGDQHRAEIAAMLTNFGASPGDLDLMRMLYD